MTGFERWRAACRAHGVAELPAAAPIPLPATVLGQALDPALRDIYAEQNGGWWSSNQVTLRIYPLDGPDALAWRNESIRRAADDFVPPYPFDDVLLFAQFGRQASYLAILPARADAAGHQPVLYLDTHEDVWAVPVAASVDAALALLADWLPGAENFPQEVPDLLARDSAFAARVRAGEFAAWLGQNAEILAWLAKCSGAQS